MKYLGMSWRASARHARMPSFLDAKLPEPPNPRMPGFLDALALGCANAWLRRCQDHEGFSFREGFSSNKRKILRDLIMVAATTPK
jgi:hypothetical protein